MREWSELFHKYYYASDCVYISNMHQIAYYMLNGNIAPDLMDIIARDDERLVFVLLKSDRTKKLFKDWCDRPHDEK